MSDAVLNAMKFAVAGTVVGVSTAYLTDTINVQVLQKIVAPAGPSNTGAQLGRLAFQVVGCAALAGTMIYAGDVVMNSVGPEGTDPLFRLFYYQIAFHTCATTMQGAKAFRNLLQYGIQQVSGPSMGPISTGPVIPQKNMTMTQQDDCGCIGGAKNCTCNHPKY